MNQASPRALARAGSLLRSVVPLLRGAVSGAASAVDDWMTSILGEEFNDRMKRVPLTLGAGGVDPFGLDPRRTKWALAATAVAKPDSTRNVFSLLETAALVRAHVIHDQAIADAMATT